jgi:hypothetical protein
MDISGTNTLYATAPISTNTGSSIGSLDNYEYVLGYADFESSTLPTLLTTTGDATSSNFIWSGTFGISTAGTAGADADLSGQFNANVIDVTTFANVSALEYNTGLYLHKDHPDLENLYLDYGQTASSSSAVTISEQGVSLQALVNNAIYTMPITATLETSGRITPYQALVSGVLNVNSVLSKKQLGFMEMDGKIAAGDRSFKMSFDANDQYLLGGKSVGSFLFLSPINPDTLSVSGETKQSTKSVENGENNGLSLDVVFQYRMTDYYGNDAESDIGRIGGFTKFGFGNLTYTKKIGLDIFDKYDNQFSFDLEVFAKYSPKGKNLNSIRAAQLVR